MKSVIFSKFRLEKYLRYMGWKSVPANHWAADKDNQEVHWDGKNWKVGNYIVCDEWIGD